MKNIDNAIYEAAKKLDLPVDTVKTVYSYIYRNGFYRQVLDGEGVSFYMPKFGTFRYSYLKVIEQALSIIRKIKRWRVSTQYTEERRADILNNLYRDLRMCLKIRRQLIEESKTYFDGNVSRLLKSSTRRKLGWNSRSNQE